MSLARDVRCLLVRELDAFRREIALFPDDESLWRVVPGVANPAGTLALQRLVPFAKPAGMGEERFARTFSQTLKVLRRVPGLR